MIYLLIAIGVLTLLAGLVAAGIIRVRDKKWEEAFEGLRAENLRKVRKAFRIPLDKVQRRTATEQRDDE